MKCVNIKAENIKNDMALWDGVFSFGR